MDRPSRRLKAALLPSSVPGTSLSPEEMGCLATDGGACTEPAARPCKETNSMIGGVAKVLHVCGCANLQGYLRYTCRSNDIKHRSIKRVDA
ncbi:hypothetical protein TNCV_1198291 [Trichonephila clavipes]|uniref:Uncharacterized protein n=1 Tax=Trichonephila clavipes TaxID=2585209 RepID=A0A8X6S1H2_TRICX|nr:hypothetical protein TNCV_1198291 [Trichonephila clavipes]